MSDVAELTDEKIANIRARYAEGWSAGVISKKMKIPKTVVFKLVRSVTPTIDKHKKSSLLVSKRSFQVKKKYGRANDSLADGRDIDDWFFS